MFRITFWLVTFLMAMLYLALLFWIEPQLSALADGAPLLDLRPFGYDRGDALIYFAALGAAGREIYRAYWFPLDMAFLLALSAFFVLAIKALFDARAGVWKWVSVALPLAYGMSDAMENLLVSAILKVGPDNLQPGAVWLASLMTRAKFVLFAALVLLLLGGLLRVAVAGRRR